LRHWPRFRLLDTHNPRLTKHTETQRMDRMEPPLRDTAILPILLMALPINVMETQLMVPTEATIDRMATPFTAQTELPHRLTEIRRTLLGQAVNVVRASDIAIPFIVIKSLRANLVRLSQVSLTLLLIERPRSRRSPSARLGEILPASASRFVDHGNN
jgi:hypothetical protein